MKNLTDIFLKARSGVYKDTSENRRLHRVGQKYGESKQPEDDEKDKKEVDPAKELEAVNKVIEAINNKKMTLPPDQIMVLIEKKNKLELAKKQAEKINAGVKANEEKRNVKEVKETNKKINEASKRKKKYGDMNVEEAKRELLGKDLTITDIETGKTRTEKITSILEGNVRGHETVMARVEGGGTYPIKHIDTGKEWKAWKLNLNSPSKETKSEPKKERVTLDGWVSNSFSDVKDYGDKGRVVSMSVSAVPDFEKMKYVYVAAVGSSHVLPEDTDKFLKESNDLNKKTFDSPNEAAKAADEFAAKWNKKEVKQVEVEDVKKKKSSLKEELDHQNNELDNLENKKEDYIKQHGEEKYNERHKKIEDKIEDTRKELDNLKGSDKTGGNEEKETYTRVKFDDLPNSGKVNLKKYLSDKVKRTADENLGILSKVSTENLKKMEAGLVKEFNSQFDDLPKSRRAEKLYSIMKVKAELAQRGSETKNGENNSNKNIKKAVEEVSANFENLADKVDKNGWNMQYIKYGDIDSFDFDEKGSTLTVHATGKGYGNTKSTKTELTQKDFDEYNKTAKWVTNFRGEREPVTTDAHGAITIAKELKDKGIDVKKIVVVKEYD